MQDSPQIKVNTNADVLVVDCESCVMRASSACDDCVVSFFCDDSGAQGVVLDLEEQRTLRMLANAGLVPTLRHRAVS